MTEADADSPVVTIFADQGPLVSEIDTKIRDRGATTHTVSVDVGWIDSVSCALVVLDSTAGMSAMRALSDLPDSRVNVVVVMAEEVSPDAERLCEGCRERHHLVTMRANQTDLADRIADQIVGDRRR
ncbi:MAG: hypothetical protein WB508_03810 [Aeromicrobium sp.]|uniref:hypothetical protein n=1 Tax=Aeromicrobium sp. TaxID=1871063 RepID=UPI003C69B07F